MPSLLYSHPATTLRVTVFDVILFTVGADGVFVFSDLSVLISTPSLEQLNGAVSVLATIFWKSRAE